MDRSKFDGWVQDAGLDSKVSAAFYTSMSDYANADKVLTMATKRGWSAKQMVSLLKNQGVFTAGIEAVMGQSSTPELTPLPARRIVRPVLPVFDRPSREASADEPAQKRNILHKLGLMKPSSDDPETPKKGLSRTWVIVIIVVIAVILLAVGYFMFGRGNSYGSSYDFGSQPSFVEPAPTYEPALDFAPQTPNLSPLDIIEQKEETSQEIIVNALPSDFLNGPKSFQDLVENFPWNWILYFLGAPMMLFLVFRERTQAREFSDSKLASFGLLTMLFFVMSSGPVSAYVAAAGMANSQFFLFVYLTIGFLLNMSLQFAAFLSGIKDYSVIAMGIYVSGLLLNWWFHGSLANPIFGTIGVILMIVGIVIQLKEISRSGSTAASIFGTLLMLLFFAGSYAGIFSLITSKLALMDPGIIFRLLKQTQILVSALVGIGIAMMIGLIYGSIFLQPTSQAPGRQIQDGNVDLSKLNILDADSQGLFVMVLFLSLPFIWVLPFLILLL